MLYERTSCLRTIKERYTVKVKTRLAYIAWKNVELGGNELPWLGIITIHTPATSRQLLCFQIKPFPWFLYQWSIYHKTFEILESYERKIQEKFSTISNSQQNTQQTVPKWPDQRNEQSWGTFIVLSPVQESELINTGWNSPFLGVC